MFTYVWYVCDVCVMWCTSVRVRCEWGMSGGVRMCGVLFVAGVLCVHVWYVWYMWVVHGGVCVCPQGGRK